MKNVLIVQYNYYKKSEIIVNTERVKISIVEKFIIVQLFLKLVKLSVIFFDKNVKFPDEFKYYKISFTFII